MKSTEAKAGVELGRMLFTVVDIGHLQQVLIMNIYGWTGGAKHPDTALRTDALLEAARVECDLHPAMPTFLVGDFNGDTCNFQTRSLLTKCKAWTDLGAAAAQWGEEPCQPTCKAFGSKAETRRDYAFANPLALRLVRGFKTAVCDEFSVHRVLQVLIEPTDSSAYNRVNSSFPSLTELVDRHIDKASKARGFDEGTKEHKKFRRDELEQLSHTINRKVLPWAPQFDQLQADEDTDSCWEL